MRSSIKVFLFTAAALVLSNCAHSHKVEGPQVAAEIPAGFRVHIDSKEVKEGDKVNVFRRTCKTLKGPARGRIESGPKCNNQKIGEATVLKVLDHDAVVSPDADLVMEEGMFVEKK